MTNKEIYKLWAPVGKRWVDWVRPVPFIEINNALKPYQPFNIVLPYFASLEKVDPTSAIIVDLPDYESVEAGIVLAKLGYRPIPIYNGVMEPKGTKCTTDNRSVLPALVWGASILSDIELSDDAPPAFLIDSNRLDRFRENLSVFDNSWDVYPQDLPSENYFLEHGISRIVIITRSNKIPRDLLEIFNDYPKKQVSIFLTDGSDEPKCVKKRKNDNH